MYGYKPRRDGRGQFRVDADGTMSLTDHDKRQVSIGLIVVIVAIVVIGVILAIAQGTWLHAVYIGLRGIPSRGGLILTMLAGVAIWGYWRNKRVLAAAALVAAFGLTQLLTADFRAEQSALARGTTVDASATLPSLTPRVPYVQAKASARSGITTNGAQRGETTYVPTDGAWSTLVSSTAWTGGYSEIVWQAEDPRGHLIPSNCHFKTDAANQSLGGILPSNLDRAILWAGGWGNRWDASDAYGFCKGDHPYVVIPLIAYDGWLSPVAIPAGVAIYDGWTGALTMKPEVKPGELPGPVYPMSLAKSAWETTRAGGSWTDYVRQIVGYDDTTTDTADPNAGNLSEFTMALADGSGTVYVTPLTMRGASSQIAAVAITQASFVTAGQRNATTIIPASRLANSAIESSIRSTFAALEWASGLKVSEIVPLGQGQWLATLGYQQELRYRVGIDKSGAMTLFKADGTKVSEAPSAGPVPSMDLKSMTPAELADLIQKATSELAGRAQG